MTPDQLYDAQLGLYVCAAIVLALIAGYVIWALNEAREDFDRRLGEQCLDLEIKETGGLPDVVQQRWGIR